MRDETARLCKTLNKCGLSVSLHSWEEVGWWAVGVVCRNGHKPVGASATETELQGPQSQAVRVTEHACLPSMRGVGQNQQRPDRPCAEHAGSEQQHQPAESVPSTPELLVWGEVAGIISLSGHLFSPGLLW